MKKSFRGVVLLCTAFALQAFTLGCEKSIPITIAAVGDIDMQAAPKDKSFEFGLTLAREDIKLDEGINGADVEIVYIGDERNDGRAVAETDAKALKMGAIALISNRSRGLSTNSLAPLAEEATVMIGANELDSQLRGKDDFFINIQPSEKQLAEELATFAVQKLQLTQIGLVLQEKANPMNKLFMDAFNSKAQSLGADNELLYSYEARDLEAARQNIGSYEPEKGRGILIVADPADTKIFARLSRQTIMQDIPVLAAPWGIDKEPDTNFNGVIFPMSFDPDSKTAYYEIFRRNFQRRFGIRVDAQAVSAYDSLMVLADTLREAGRDRELLKEAILKKGEFEGLQGPIKFDKNGDCIRPVHILTVKDKILRRYDAAL